MNALQLIIKSSNGFIAYVNGVEVYRYKISYSVPLPDGLDTSSNADDNYYKMVTLKKYLLNDSTSNTIAFEVHIASSSVSSEDSFGLYLGRVGNGVSTEFATTRINTFNIVSNPATTSAYNAVWKIIDNIDNTYWSISGTSTANITYTFPHQNAEYINCYSLRNTQYSYYGTINSWYLLGSNDNENWTFIDYRNDPFPTGTVERREYTIPGNVGSFKQLRLMLLDTPDNKYSISDFTVGVCNLPNIGNELHYEENTISGYSGFLNVNIICSTTMFTSFTVNPPFPSGLSINSETGTISGTPVGNGITTHNITAIHRFNGASSSFIFTINLSSCPLNTHTHWYFLKTNKNYANEESYSIYTLNGTLLYSSPTFTNNVNQELHLCIPSEPLRITVADTFNDGWTNGAYLQININNGISDLQLGKIANYKYGDREFVFDPLAILPTMSTSWTYIQGSVPSNWYETTTTGSFSPYSYNTAPASTSNVWLFRNTFTVSSLNSIAALDIKVYVRDGFILYLNGQEVYRFNIAETVNVTIPMEPTTGENSISYFSLSASPNYLIVGENTIAVGIINRSNNNPSTILFDAFILPIRENQIGRTYDMVLTCSAATTTSALIDFRSDYDWTGYHAVDTPLTLTYAMPERSPEYFNKICMTSGVGSASEKSDPKDFSFSVSNDDSSYTTIYETTDFYFTGRRQEHCFYLANNKKPWRYYKVTLTAHRDPSATSYIISELYPYQADLSVLQVPDLQYNVTSITAISGLPFPEIASNSPLYSSYTISPDLPTPLTLDHSTGRIVGTYTGTFPSTQFTITAISPLGVSSSTQIMIQIIPCGAPNIMFTIMIKTATWGNEMGFIFKNRHGDILMQKEGFDRQATYYYPFCELADTYYFTATDSNSDGWDNGFYKIYLNDNTTVLEGTLGARVASETYVVSVGYVISPIESEYRYFIGHEAPSDWNTIEFSDDSWPIGTTTNFGIASSITQYFRRSFNIEYPDSYSDFSFTIKSRYGYIIYLNGKEIFRYNMPHGSITSTTHSIEDKTTVISTSRSLPFLHISLRQGINVFAVEVHLPVGLINVDVSFDGSLLLYAENTYKGNNGVATSDLEDDDNIKYVFDNDKGSSYYNKDSCIGRTLTYTYNDNRRPLVNSYSIYTGNQCNRRHPSGWRIEGSNDGQNWILLHRVENQIFDSYNMEVRFHFYNEIGYNSYRMIITQCNNIGLGTPQVEAFCSYPSSTNPGLQINELSFYSRNMTHYCRPQDGYLGVLEGELSYKECDQYYTGRIQSTCSNGVFIDPIPECTVDEVKSITYDSLLQMTQNQYASFEPVVYGIEYECFIEPTLPDGLNFDNSTGRIYGTSTSIFTVKTFNVTCQNKAGGRTVDILLSCIEQPASLWWMYLIIAILALILITIVVFCIVNRSKSRKMNHKNLEKNRKTGKNQSPPTTNTKSVKI